MKRLLKLLMLTSVVLFLAGCSQVIERADRTITLTQDTVTEITNTISEIQILEGNIQADFEATLSQSEDLSAFNSDDSPIFQNITNRNNHLTSLTEHVETIGGLSEELTAQRDGQNMPVEQIDTIISLLDGLNTDLEVYVSDYQANLNNEKMTYRSIASPETTYQSFFQTFDNISVITTNNQMNLEKVLTYFEPLNANLINFKIYLADIQEAN